MVNRSERLKQAVILGLGLLLCAFSATACGAKGSPNASATPTLSGTAIPMMTIVTPTPGLPSAPGSTGATPTEAAQQSQNGQNGTYTVQPGDTLFSIATKFNVTIDALMKANSITDPTALQANQLLVIP
ncbi:MAG TPA: LysM domain-containing protein [Nitrolancea sp.]